MKIVYCLQGTYVSGGIERIVISKANYFSQKGHSVFIITTDQKDRAPFYKLNKEVKCIDLAINYSDDNSLSRFHRTFNTIKKKKTHRKVLTTILKKLSPDIVISTFFHEASFLPRISDGSIKILEVHTSMYAPVLMYRKKDTLLRLYGRYVVRNKKIIASQFDQLIVLTQEEKKKWKKSNVTVIPNSNSLQNVSKHSPLSNKIVLAVGRFEYAKNYSELINIWNTIYNHYPDWKLVIVGDGYLREFLQSQINSLGLDNEITLAPTTKEIEKYYLEASIMVLTSHFEGLPMVLIEAQSYGLPIVSYACPSGPKDIITDEKDGFLIPPYDTNAFINHLLFLMGNYEIRKMMGAIALESSKRFSKDIIMDKWDDLFNKLTKEQNE